MTITGQNSHFTTASSTTNVYFSQGSSTIEATDVIVTTDESLVATMTIPATASTGLWDVTVATISALVTKLDGFTVLPLDAEPHFEPVFSDNPFLPMNVFVTAAAIDGEALSAGDEVAIMDGDRVVGHVVLEGPIPEPFVSIPASTAEADAANGFVPGNNIAFRLWDASAGMEIAAVTATFADLTTGEPIAAPLFASQGQAAVRLEVTTCILGDVDMNGEIQFEDAYLVADYELDPATGLPEGSDITCGDFNKDGRITILDALMIGTHVLDPAITDLPSGTGEEPTTEFIAPSRVLPFSTFDVQMNLDIPVDESLGAFTVTHTWSSELLEFKSVRAGSFGRLHSNVNSAEAGEILISSFNPEGGDDGVTLATVSFTAVGEVGDATRLVSQLNSAFQALTFIELTSDSEISEHVIEVVAPTVAKPELPETFVVSEPEVSISFDTQIDFQNPEEVSKIEVDFVTLLSQLLGISPDRIVITAISPGSIIINFVIVEDEDDPGAPSSAALVDEIQRVVEEDSNSFDEIAPVLSVEDIKTGSLDFGALAADEVATEVLSYEKAGSDDTALEVSVLLNGEGFRTSRSSLSIGTPGGVGSFEVSFDAGAVGNIGGEYMGILTVFTNDPRNRKTVINLKATVEKPTVVLSQPDQDRLVSLGEEVTVTWSGQGADPDDVVTVDRRGTRTPILTTAATSFSKKASLGPARPPGALTVLKRVCIIFSPSSPTMTASLGTVMLRGPSL